jgi:hypothetical protein
MVVVWIRALIPLRRLVAIPVAEAQSPGEDNQR